MKQCYGERRKNVGLEIDNCRDLGMRKVDKILYVLVMWGEKKGMDERTVESVHKWFGHIERMFNNFIPKRMHKN